METSKRLVASPTSRPGASYNKGASVAPKPPLKPK